MNLQMNATMRKKSAKKSLRVRICHPLSFFHQSTFLVFLCLGSLWGCSDGQQGVTGKSSGVRPPLPLRSVSVLVVDAPELSSVVNRQWKARTESELKVTDVTWSELAAAKFDTLSQYEVVVYPSCRVVELAAQEKLGQIDSRLLADSDFNQRGRLFFERALGEYGGKPLAVSLGGAIPVLLCRSDVLEECGVDAPKSWSEFSALANKLKTLDADPALPRDVLVPLQGDWASHAVALRSASAIRKLGRYSTFFDVNSMAPLVASQPFLESLIAWKQDLSRPHEALSPREVLNAFANGESGHGDHHFAWAVAQ